MHKDVVTNTIPNIYWKYIKYLHENGLQYKHLNTPHTHTQNLKCGKIIRMLFKIILKCTKNILYILFVKNMYIQTRIQE